MITMTSSKATPNPMMTLLSTFGKSDFELAWEPWRKSVREALGSTDIPHPTPPLLSSRGHSPAPPAPAAPAVPLHPGLPG